MAWRFFTFLLCQLAGGLTGWWLGQERGALAGLLAGALLWIALDTWRVARLLAWQLTLKHI
jgi:two-component system phosphate regulon sensor histidine kinase PhoR